EFAASVAFVHARNVRLSGERVFHEVAHHRSAGDIDLAAAMKALLDAGVDVPIRPDHGRMLWGAEAIPGSGLYDRAIGLAYLQGVEQDQLLAAAAPRGRDRDAAGDPFPVGAAESSNGEGAGRRRARTGRGACPRR